MPAASDFPRQQVRTRRFTLGAPRNFTISPDGRRVVFLRSPAGDDPATAMWVYSTGTGTEVEVANPAKLLGGGQEDLPLAERARRERSRELAGGIVGYACDDAVLHAAFALGGRLWWVDLDAATCRPLSAPAGVIDPRPSPNGRHVAFVSEAALYVVGASGNGACAVLAEEDADEVSWGVAEFIAAEEMDRQRGFWWSPDGGSLLAARADNSAVLTWWTADPAEPAAAPQAHRYPAAGSHDASVTLWHVGLDGDRREVRWDVDGYPYLVDVHWSAYGPPLLLVESRDHKQCAVLAADLATGEAHQIESAADAAWVGWAKGTPAWLDGGRLLWSAAASGTWRLTVDAAYITPPGLQVREVTSAGRSVVFTASSEPEVIEAWEWSPERGLRPLTKTGGVSTAYGRAEVKVVVSRAMGWHGPRAEVTVESGTAGYDSSNSIASYVQEPSVSPTVRFLKAGPRELSVGVVLPAGHKGGKLPVLMAPYGGPGHQRVMRERSLWLEAQWFADQGFAVVVADGRGTPGRGPAFEQQVYLDLAGPVLEDQVDALRAAALAVPELDLERVGIKGWSFGGYLAALAVLCRPDVFHAAVAGAPVTAWHLYDTYYSERYLGRPQDNGGSYERTSLLRLAPELSRPLMVVHGLADDNVYAAHSLELCKALLLAGKAFKFVPLPGVTHVAVREDVNASLLEAEVEFFSSALG